MKKAYFLLFLSVFIFTKINAQDPNPSESTLSIIFAGDIMGHSPQFKAAYNPQTKTYEYDICFKHVKKYISSADLALANLETPIAGAPYTGYPTFSNPDELLDALKNAGYDILQTANNHVLDKGKKGLERTIEELEKRNFLYLGSYYDQNHRDSVYPLIIEKKGLKIALFSYTYDTNGIPASYPNIVNLIDTAQIKKDIQKADETGVDLKIMSIHWGEEYQLKANKAQKELAVFLVNQGIDAIIGSHPHVVQNFESIEKSENKHVPVYYSLGNSISNQRKPHTDGGIMVKLLIDVNKKEIRDHSYLPVYVHKGKLNGTYQYHLIPTMDYIRQFPRIELSKKDSTDLMYFHTRTLERIDNAEIMPDPCNLRIMNLPKIRIHKNITALDRFRQGACSLVF